jgi:hypothetical protein
MHPDDLESCPSGSPFSIFIRQDLKTFHPLNTPLHSLAHIININMKSPPMTG